jgi:hypothetical protein
MRRVIRRSVPLAIGLGLSLLWVASAAAADATWPREINTDRGILTIYQPQPEKFENNILEGRAAVSLLSKGKTSPVFGVFWFSGRVDTNRDSSTAVIRDITVTDTRWPESDKAREEETSIFLTSLMPKTGLPISLERLRASLATLDVERKSVEGLKHDPPRIVVVQEAAELLLYDGEPRTMAIPNTEMERVANTAYAVVKDKKSGLYYLSGGKLWYSAKAPKGPWISIAKPPAEIAKLIPPDTSSTPAPAKPPKIVVATEPTELISTDGKPSWQTLGKGDLMYIANTESKVVREVASGKVFVLISGRWYQASKLEGPWAVVRPDQLPAAFKDIPPASALGDVRVSVAGTPEADDAMLDAQVPQTAAIERSKAKLEVKYDGEPQFKKIEGTSVEYAVNTVSQVLRINGKYYACDQAVWFAAGQASGPWAVADSVPMDEIKKIPPSEPVYNVTHVTVYESTPQVVYVGYTPGYIYSYPWYGVPVYGTGWYYPPYVTPYVYYPRPVTYGMHVTYNPYTGWGYGFTASNGFVTVGVGFGGYYGHPGYYPPCGYRPPYHGGYPGYGHGGYPGYGHGGYPPGGPGGPAGAPGKPGGPGGPRPSTLPSNNMYNNASNAGRNAPSTMQRDAGMQKADRVAKGPNNVYADKSGNVHRQTDQGWQSRDQGQWKSSPSASTQPSRGSSGGYGGGATAAPSNLNRDAQARQSGASRSSSSYGGGSYGGGSRGGGGGGGRRR